MVVEVVQPNLAISYYARMLRQLGQALEVRGREFLRLMRVRAHRGVNPIVLLGKRNGRVQFFRPGTGSNSEQSGNASSARPLEHRVAILRELRKINVRM